jgi:tRNA threonylcarbamoyladenosine biosynthesis protein TsaE
LRLVHVDVYRLDRVQEFLDLGLEDLAGDDAVTVVEWGDAVAAELSADHLDVQLTPWAPADAAVDNPEASPEPTEDDRELALRPRGASWNRRADRLRAQLSEPPRC